MNPQVFFAPYRALPRYGTAKVGSRSPSLPGRRQPWHVEKTTLRRAGGSGYAMQQTLVYQ